MFGLLRIDILPQANFRQKALSFPTTIVGNTSATQTVTLQNTGNAALTISSIATAGADASHYRYSADAGRPCPIAPAVLNAEASCTLEVTFAPLSPGAHNNAQIAIVDNSSNVSGTLQTVSLAGVGIALTSIAVTASNTSLGVNASEQFTATGTYSDSSTANLTTQATWTSSAPAVATISSSGVATALAAGQTSIRATLGGVSSNSFLLSVTAGAAATIVASTGSGQSTTAGSPFAAPLQALVKDAGGNPVANAGVTFTAPASGASGLFANGQSSYSTSTNSAGIASSGTFTSNSKTGTYAVTAAVSGVAARASFTLTNVTPVKPAKLTINVSHTGNFRQGQTGTYTILVSNRTSAGPTQGLVTVTEILPAGLTMVGMSGGADWNCSSLPSCTASRVLNNGTSYAPITVVVNVAANAPSSVVNQATVTGGGSADATDSDTTVIGPSRGGR